MIVFAALKMSFTAQLLLCFAQFANLQKQGVCYNHFFKKKQKTKNKNPKTQP
jgi:hypothetical protein